MLTAMAELPVTWIEVYDYMHLHFLGVYANVKSYRKGQAYFNALYEIYPEVADLIRGTDADPFYTDNRLAAFYDAIMPYFI